MNTTQMETYEQWKEAKLQKIWNLYSHIEEDKRIDSMSPEHRLEFLDDSERMREISRKLKDLSSLGLTALSEKGTYHAMGDFTIQYFQHFPDKAPKIQKSLVTRARKIPVQFTLNFNQSKTLQEMLVSRITENTKVPPELLSIVDSKAPKGYRLFRLVSHGQQTGSYVQIPTAGSPGQTGFSVK